MDNATSNDTCAEMLEIKLQEHDIMFSADDSRIRYTIYGLTFTDLLTLNRCFPHIVNLACQAMLDAITNIDHITAPDSIRKR